MTKTKEECQNWQQRFIILESEMKNLSNIAKRHDKVIYGELPDGSDGLRLILYDNNQTIKTVKKISYYILTITIGAMCSVIIAIISHVFKIV